MTSHPQVVMLMPVSQMAKPNPHYQNPAIEKCPSCGTDVWMSDRKRVLRETGHECLCGLCCIKKYGPFIDVIDITKPH